MMEAFWERITPTGFCWEWTGTMDPSGYGRFALPYAGFQLVGLAHRLAYTLLVAPIADGMTLDHLCRNRRCVNPDHLEPVTRAENSRRAKANRTHCKSGHEFTQSDTVIARNGTRHCRECQRRWDRARSPRRRGRKVMR